MYFDSSWVNFLFFLLFFSSDLGEKIMIIIILMISLINVKFVLIFVVVAELMILGFISLLLTFGQTFIVKICIPANVSHTFLPCSYDSTQHASDEAEHHRKLLFYERRYLSEDATPVQCKEVTMLPFSIYRSRFEYKNPL